MKFISKMYEIYIENVWQKIEFNQSIVRRAQGKKQWKRRENETDRSLPFFVFFVTKCISRDHIIMAICTLIYWYLRIILKWVIFFIYLCQFKGQYSMRAILRLFSRTSNAHNGNKSNRVELVMFRCN